MSVESATATVCDRCQEELAGAVYEMRALEGKVACCLACALVYGPLVRRSALVALVVGSLLVAINQGNVILGGDASLALAWKVPLTYAVPYCVATFGAILNARIRRSHSHGFDA